MLSKNGHKSLGYISRKTSTYSSSPANRMIIKPEERKHVKNKIKELLDINSLFGIIKNREKILETNVIDESSIYLLKSGNDEEFFKCCEKNLIELEKKFMKERGVTPNSSSETAETIIDTE